MSKQNNLITGLKNIKRDFIRTVTKSVLGQDVELDDFIQEVDG